MIDTPSNKELFRTTEEFFDYIENLMNAISSRDWAIDSNAVVSTFYKEFIDYGYDKTEAKFLSMGIGHYFLHNFTQTAVCVN